MKGDFVLMDKVKGVNGIFPEEIRPIRNIIDSYSFEIEDTSTYSKYERGGYVIGANYPKNFKYTNLFAQFNYP